MNIDKKKYLKDNGMHCPVCGFDEMNGGDAAELVHCGGLAYADLDCLRCGSSWKEEYTLTNIDDVCIGHQWEEVSDALGQIEDKSVHSAHLAGSTMSVNRTQAIAPFLHSNPHVPHR